MHKTKLAKTFKEQGISLKKESIHLRKNRFIFCAVKHILPKYEKRSLENVVFDLITWIRVKRWVTRQKVHFKHT